jgi:hypothetical protein
MINYKDRTWCGSDCINTDCPRNMTPDEYDRAKVWWGSVPVPIAFADLSKDCPDYIAPTTPPALD